MQRKSCGASVKDSAPSVERDRFITVYFLEEQGGASFRETPRTPVASL